MNKLTHRGAIGLAVVLSAVPILARAVDYYPPCWRGLPSATYQDWEFLSTPTNLYGPEVTTPEAKSNANGTPQAAISDLTSNGSSGWRLDPTLSATLRGWWDLGFGASGTITLTVPNVSSGTTRTIAVQVTEAYGGPGIDYSTVTVAGGSLVSSQRYKYETYSGTVADDVYVSQTIWTVAATTTSDTVTVRGTATSGKISFIDSIVVDTINLNSAGAVPIGAVSPGGSASAATLASCLPVDFGGTGFYTWNIGDAQGVAGTGWDLLNVTGGLNVSATSGSKFAINVVSLNGGAAGPAANFSSTAPYFWEIVRTSTGITGFATDKFALNTAGFQNSLGSLAGSFSVTTAGNSVYLVYMPACDVNGITKSFSAPVATDPATITFNNPAGLYKVTALKTDNCALAGNAYSANNVVLSNLASVTVGSDTFLPVGTTKVVLTATKGNTGIPATVNAGAYDSCGHFLSLDPVITTLTVKSGGRVQQRFVGLPAAEHYLHVINGTPGLKSLEVNLNGRIFRLDPLVAGQVVSADLASAMLEGENNVVLLTGAGEVGASAQVLITDGALGELVALPETVTLTINSTADGVSVSWPAALSDWQLQSSASAGAGWSDVTAPPAIVGESLTVQIPTSAGAQFYRLQGPASTGSSAGVRASQAAGLAIPATQQPQPLKFTHDGIPW